LELLAWDILSGHPIDSERMTLSARLWLKFRQAGTQASEVLDFLHYPAEIVDEVEYLQSVAGQMEEEAAERKAREQKAGSQ